MKFITAFVCLSLAACQAAPPAAQALQFDANLWQAARETVSFLPEGTADPVTGTILTGWGEAKPPSEKAKARDRYRIEVTLAYGQPYDHAVSVIVHHEIKGGDGWLDTADDTAAVPKFQQEIARVARELRDGKKSA